MVCAHVDKGVLRVDETSQNSGIRIAIGDFIRNLQHARIVEIEKDRLGVDIHGGVIFQTKSLSQRDYDLMYFLPTFYSLRSRAMAMRTISTEDAIEHRQLLPGRPVVAKPFNDFTLVKPFTILQVVTAKLGQALS